MRKIDRYVISKPDSLSRLRLGSTLRIGLACGFLIGMIVVLAAFPPGPPSSAATQVDITGPDGSTQFGYDVVVLTNGNIVVTDPFWESPSFSSNVGAVYLYNGATGALISTLTGTFAGDRVGLGGVDALSNGNFVVKSDEWNRPGVADAGAITFCNGVTGCNGSVTAANSLVGAATSDFFSSVIYPLPNGKYVITSRNWNNGAISNAGMAIMCDGSFGCTGEVLPANALVGNKTNDLVGQAATILTNGNYVVHSDDWDNTGAVDAGAITFCNATTGCAGMVVSAANSLVGATAQDSIGGTANTTRLPNGNFVLRSPVWDNGGAANAGAVTLCSGTSGCSGVLSAANSRVGTTASDTVGNLNSVVPLTNGNFIVSVSDWDDGGTVDVGAVTFCTGSSPCTGAVSAANSLIGSTAGDAVGNFSGAPVALPNGNYVVGSGGWDNGAIANVGAVTRCSGTTGCTGPVTTANSLVGVTTVDVVGASPVVALPNSNFVAPSRLWNNGAIVDAGAVTFCDSNTGCAGQQVTTANSLTGSVANDLVGSGGVIALTNGKYVVASPGWAASNIGAATLCDGVTGCKGITPSAANSLVGSTSGDGVANRLRALTNGNYLVLSPGWDRGGIVDAGAVTFCTGSTGCTGTVSISNSLVGSSLSDFVGLAANGPGIDPAIPLPNGNYLVNGTGWNNGSAVDAGAVTFCNGSSGCAGAISSSNSLVGSTSLDRVGYRETGPIFLNGLSVLPSGDYLVLSGDWDNAGTTDAGAATYGSATAGVSGAISATNSVLGTVANEGGELNAVFDSVNNQMVVGRPAESIVSLFRIGGGGPTPTPTPSSISGVVTYGTTPVGQSAKFVPGVLLSAAGSIPANASTNASGAYALSGLGGGPYTVTPSKSGDVSGISGLDAARVAQHVAGLIVLTPNQQVAGDSTNNGSLSGLDAARIAQTAAGIPNNGITGQWKFLPASRSYANVAASLTNENYEAVLVGDVTGNWAPAAARPVSGEADRVVARDVPGATDSSYPVLDGFRLGGGDAVEIGVQADVAGARGSTVTVPLLVANTRGRGILAYDLELEFDPAVMRPAAVDSVGSAGTLSEGWTVVHNAETPGRIRVTGFSTGPLVGKGTLLNLRFEVIGENQVAGGLRWSSFQLNEGEVPVRLGVGQTADSDGSVWFSSNRFGGSGRILGAGERRLLFWQ
jgi:hypothetical protein